jgi:type IV pilus assembly protein PilA
MKSMFHKIVKKNAIISNNNGMTLMELLCVLGIIGILASMASTMFIDYRQKAYNSAAIADGRNLVTATSNSVIDEEDVDYEHTAADGHRIGIFDLDGNDRDPIFGLSPGVRARITGSSDHYPEGQAYMEAFLYHTNGTRDASTPSGYREYYCVVDELAGEISFAVD